MRSQKYYSKEAALEKLKSYCAYQERCHSEVRNKLLEMNIFGDTLEEIIATLIEENFLNEERFATQFTLGKFRIKKWGKVRIRQELKLRKISDYCIRQAMNQIDEKDYNATITYWINKEKTEENSEKEIYRLANFLLRKGFETELIWKELKGTI